MHFITTIVSQGMVAKQYYKLSLKIASKFFKQFLTIVRQVISVLCSQLYYCCRIPHSKLVHSRKGVYKNALQLCETHLSTYILMSSDGQ